MREIVGWETRNGSDSSVVIASEFAAVRLTIDTRGNGPRLLVEDLDTGASVFIEPLELASFCLALNQDRVGWLSVGAYRPGAEVDLDDGE